MTAAHRSFAVVTGASSGIGLELARQFAEHDFDVLICAEDDELEAAAAQLRTTGAAVVTARVDLATAEGNEAVAQAVLEAGRPVDALALNAGVGNGGPFLESDLAADLALIDLNVKSVVHLAKRLIPTMATRGSGRVLITSSIAATQPGPGYATYAASKAFLLSFSEAIRHELKDSGVTVTALMPGPTDTEFFERGGLEGTRVDEGPKDDAADVAADGFQALMDGKDSVVAGSLKNKAMVAGSKIMPERAKAAVHAAMTKQTGTETGTSD
jgi:short-subunit dehydrogenase